MALRFTPDYKAVRAAFPDLELSDERLNGLFLLVAASSPGERIDTSGLRPGETGILLHLAVELYHKHRAAALRLVGDQIERIREDLDPARAADGGQS